MAVKRELPACGNSKCGCSTGVHEGLTFGSGRLTSHGFWEYPCRPCAAASDLNQKTILDQIVEELRAKGKTQAQIGAHLRWNCEWLTMPAWPYASSDIKELENDIQKELALDAKEDDEFDRIFAREQIEETSAANEKSISDPCLKKVMPTRKRG